MGSSWIHSKENVFKRSNLSKPITLSIWQPEYLPNWDLGFSLGLREWRKLEGLRSLCESGWTRLRALPSREAQRQEERISWRQSGLSQWYPRFKSPRWVLFLLFVSFRIKIGSTCVNGPAVSKTNCVHLILVVPYAARCCGLVGLLMSVCVWRDLPTFEMVRRNWSNLLLCSCIMLTVVDDDNSLEKTYWHVDTATMWWISFKIRM